MNATITLHKRTDYTIEAPAYGESLDIDQIKRLADQMGSHYFEPATMRFFRSRVDNETFTGLDGWYFVTSEQHESMSGGMCPRRYSVRRFQYEQDEAGNFSGVDFDTIGEFQEHATLRRARTAARKVAESTWAHRKADISEGEKPC
jgi:hypothetical protein